MAFPGPAPRIGEGFRNRFPPVVIGRNAGGAIAGFGRSGAQPGDSREHRGDQEDRRRKEKTFRAPGHRPPSSPDGERPRSSSRAFSTMGLNGSSSRNRSSCSFARSGRPCLIRATARLNRAWEYCG